MAGQHRRTQPPPEPSRPSGLLKGQTDRPIRRDLQRVAEPLRERYGDPASEASETPATGPHPAGEATGVGRAVARPGTPEVPPVTDDGVPGQTSRPGRAAQDAAPGTGTSEWTVALPAGLRLLSLNDRIHWSVKGRITRDLRHAAFVMARNAKVPHLERARVVVEYQPPPLTRRRDLDNVGPASGKPCIDGLVDARVLSDDSPQYLTEVAYRIGEPFPRGRLVLHVEAVAAT